MKHHSSLSHVIVLIAILSATAGASLPHAASAQAFWRVEETKTNVGTYFYFYVNPGTATIRVQVLGAVRSPGLYEISENTDLGHLIALSGGPPIGVRQPGTDLDISLKLYRPGVGERLVFDENFDDAILNPTSYPLLVDGDIVMVDVTEQHRFGWRDATRIASTVGVLAIAFERIFRAVN